MPIFDGIHIEDADKLALHKLLSGFMLYTPESSNYLWKLSTALSNPINFYTEKRVWWRIIPYITNYKHVYYISVNPGEFRTEESNDIDCTILEFPNLDGINNLSLELEKVLDEINNENLFRKSDMFKSLLAIGRNVVHNPEAIYERGISRLKEASENIPNKTQSEYKNIIDNLYE